MSPSELLGANDKVKNIGGQTNCTKTSLQKRQLFLEYFCMLTLPSCKNNLTPIRDVHYTKYNI